MKNVKTTLLVAAALALTGGAAAQSQHKTVLFVGNSYTSVNNLPQLISLVASSMGDSLEYTVSAPGGCTFAQHCTNQSMSYISQGGWDAVVLQEQSQYPSFPDWQVEQEVFPFAERLVDSIYAASPCAEPMFYMTWGRKNGDKYNAEAFPPLGTYEGMDSLLALRYRQMADMNDASLCPVGRVWHLLRDTHPEIELYQNDESHPSRAGSYAAACAFYVMLFHRDPDSIVYAADLPGPMSSSIRAAVRSVVFDSLASWQRPLPAMTVELPDTVAWMSLSFELDAANSDSVSVDWGDGTGTLMAWTEGLMPMEHTYGDTGSYVVNISVYRHCMMADTTLAFSAQRDSNSAESIAVASAVGLALSPNPAKDRVRIVSGEVPEAVVVCDMQGRVRKIVRPEDSTTVLDVSQLTPGCYVLRAVMPSGIVMRRMVVAR